MPEHQKHNSDATNQLHDRIQTDYRKGTCLFEGKDYFTIYDFVKAYEHFNDPEWDGDPEEPEPVQPKPPGGDSPPGPDDGPDEPVEPKKKIKVKLADGKERQIQYMMATSFYDSDGPISSEEFIHKLFGDLLSILKRKMNSLKSGPAKPGKHY